MTADNFFHYPSTLHQQGGVLAFADGHVERHRWSDPETRKTVPAPHFLDLSNPASRNRDLLWLREHTTLRR
jgi:prepilin-type processing-associated H-X9-DG protein